MTREEKLETALKTCREQFQLYGDLHRAKDPPQIEKAKVNYALVGTINAALASEDDVGPVETPEGWDMGPVSSTGAIDVLPRI